MRSYGRSLNPPVLLGLAVSFLLLVGVVEYYSAAVYATDIRVDRLFPPEFLKYGLRILLAFAVFVFVQWVDLRRWIHPQYVSYEDEGWPQRIPYFRIMAIGTPILLVLVLFFGKEVGGARRWIFGFQPAELAKVFWVMYLSRYISESEEDLTRSLVGWVPALVVLGLLSFLIALEPNISTVAFLWFVFFAYVILAGPIWSLPVFAPLALGGFILVIRHFPHAARRVESLLSGDLPEQVRMALAAIHEGGWLGKGPGRGLLKFEIPQVHNDFIFAVIGEEMGVVGMTLVLLAFLVILWATREALRSPRLYDDEKLLVYGAGMVLVLQAFVHIGVNLGLLPPTGQVLPFISRGGSNLVVSAWCLGILWKGAAESHS